MFINIDYNKKPQESKLHLAKPNKQIITHISEKFNDSVTLRLGNINELSFSIPHYIDNEKNENIDLIKEKMLIKLTLGTYQEWYVIDEIVEDSGDSDIFNVKGFSLGYELKDKRIKNLNMEAVNAETLLSEILSESVWSIGTIDPMFNAMFRSFEITDSNSLDGVLQAGETYGALIVWDTLNKTISFKNMSDDGSFKGMTINYGRFLNSITRTRTTDEMVTRLYIEGNEGLTIHNVNPTGQGYIENFDYFMYPFERDVNKNTIKSSHFMSDDLCHAILDHQEKVELAMPDIKSLYDLRTPKINQLTTEESALEDLKLELDTILELLDMAQATDDSTLVTQRKSERDAKQNEINNKEATINSINNDIANIDSQIEIKQNTISHDANFTQTLLNELNLFIIEKEWIDDRYTDEQELYDDGLKKFLEIKQPRVVIDVSIDNLLNIIEEQYYWDKLVIGDLVKVKYPQMNIEYMAKIIEINYNLEEGEANLVIANTNDLLNETDKLVQLLYSSSNATTMIQNNKYKWDKINYVESEMQTFFNSEWDANKNKITAGVNNDVEFGKRGIIIRNPDFPQEVVIMQSGIIALSKDGGETWKTAIKPDGIIAERLIGRVIAGENLIITNNSGTFEFDNSGFRINADSFTLTSSSGTNLVDDWNDNFDTVNADIIDINNKVLALSDFTDTAFKDGIIDMAEKESLKTHIEQLNTEKADIDAKYNNLYADSLLTGTTKVNLQVAKNDLTTGYDKAHADLVSTINTAVSDNVISESEKTNVSNAFITYRTRLSTLSTRFEEAMSAIAQAKVDAGVDPLEERIYTAEQKITPTAIVSTVTSSSQYQGLEDRVGDAETQISQQAGEISLKATKTYVDAIQVGGRNLIKLEEIDVSSKTDYQNNQTVMLVSGAKQTKGIVYPSTTILDIGEYTLSFYKKIGVNDTGVSSVRLSTSTDGISFSTKSYMGQNFGSSEWQFVTYTFTTTVPIYFGIQIYNHNFATDFDTEVYIKGLKLEKGNKATDWTPAPEDQKAYVDAIEVGGRNLIIPSEIIYRHSDGKVVVDDYNMTLNVLSVELVLYLIPVQPNTEYTISYKGNKVFSRANEHFQKPLTFNDSLVVAYPEITSGMTIQTTSTTTWLSVGVYGNYSSESYPQTLSEWKVEKGNKATDWTPAPEHVQSAIDGLAQDVVDLDTALGNLDTEINTTFKDGIISEAEAKSIEKYLNIVSTEKLDVDNRYTTIYADPYLLGTAKTNLSSAKTAYNTAHTNLLSSINTAIADGKTTTAEKTDVDTKYTAYKNAIATLSTRFEEAILASTNQKANGNLVNNPAISGTKEGWDSSYTLVDDTFNGVSTKAMKITTSSSVQAYGDFFKVDPSKAYEVSVWVRKSSAIGRVYLGLTTVDSGGATVPVRAVANTAETGSDNSNFYFSHTTTVGNSPTVYTRFYGFILPAGTPDSALKGLQENNPLNGQNNASFKQNTDRMRVRILNWENTTSQDLFVVNPTVREIDPSSISRVAKSEAELLIQSDLISTKVSKDGVISAIEQSPESIKISAGNIDITGAVTFSSFDTSTKGVLSNADTSIINANPMFLDWTSTVPTGYGTFSTTLGSTMTKVASGNGMGNSLQFGVVAGSSAYLNPVQVTTNPYFQYTVVEITFCLISGTIDGAGVLARYNATANIDNHVHLKSIVSAPILNKWYTVTKTIKVASATPTAGFTGYSIYPMGGWSSFGTVTAKTIQFDAIKFRPATEQEINAYESGTLVNGWKTAGTTKIDGGEITTDSIRVTKLSSLSSNLGTVTAGDITGATMNLAGGKFIVDASGNVTFKGALSGATGTFSGTINVGIATTSANNVQLTTGDLTIQSTIYKSRLSNQELSIENLTGTTKYNLRLFNNNIDFGMTDSGGVSIGDTSISLSTGTAYTAFLWIRANNAIKIEAGSGDNIEFNTMAGENRFKMYEEGTYKHKVLSAPNGLIKILNSTTELIQFRKGDDSGLINIQALNVAVSSLRSLKKNIEPYTVDALREVATTPVYSYHMLEDGDNEMKRTGLIYDEVPADIADISGNGVSLYAMSAVMWRAIQQLNDRVELLQNRIDELELQV